MLYPVYVYPGDGQTAHGIIFPDFPGCHSAADTWEDIPSMCQQAMLAHFAGEPANNVPAPSNPSDLESSGQYAGGLWMLVELDASALDAEPVQLKVSLPAHLVQSIDAYVEQHGMTRSSFLTEAAQAAMTA